MGTTQGIFLSTGTWSRRAHCCSHVDLATRQYLVKGCAHVLGSSGCSRVAWLLRQFTRFFLTETMFRRLLGHRCIPVEWFRDPEVPSLKKNPRPSNSKSADAAKNIGARRQHANSWTPQAEAKKARRRSVFLCISRSLLPFSIEFLLTSPKPSAKNACGHARKPKPPYP